MMPITTVECEEQGPFFIYSVSVQTTSPQDILDLARYLREDPSGRYLELAVAFEAAVGEGENT